MNLGAAFSLFCRFKRLLFFLTDAFVTRGEREGVAGRRSHTISLYIPVPICIAAMIVSVFLNFIISTNLFFFLYLDIN